MPQGTVEKVGISRTNKPTVTVDGQLYSASKTEPPVSALRQGDKIEFDSASSQFNGSTVWFMNSWKLLEGAQKYPLDKVGPEATRAPIPSNGLTEGERMFASNLCAALASHGTLISPDQVLPWVKAVRAAMRGEESDPDDKIPF